MFNWETFVNVTLGSPYDSDSTYDGVPVSKANNAESAALTVLELGALDLRPHRFERMGRLTLGNMLDVCAICSRKKLWPYHT